MLSRRDLRHLVDGGRSFLITMEPVITSTIYPHIWIKHMHAFSWKKLSRNYDSYVCGRRLEKVDRAFLDHALKTKEVQPPSCRYSGKDHTPYTENGRPELQDSEGKRRKEIVDRDRLKPLQHVREAPTQENFEQEGRRMADWERSSSDYKALRINSHIIICNNNQ